MDQEKSDRIVAQLEELAEKGVMRWEVEPHGQYLACGEIRVSLRGDNGVSRLDEKNEWTRITNPAPKLVALLRRKLEESRAQTRAIIATKQEARENEAQDAMLEQLANLNTLIKGPEISQLEEEH